MRGARIEQLLGGGRIGQTQTELARVAEREIQVLLVQLDAKTGLKRALDHALAMQLEHTRRRESTHQRLAHFGWIRSRLRGEQQCLRNSFDVECDDDLISN